MSGSLAVSHYLVSCLLISRSFTGNISLTGCQSLMAVTGRNGWCGLLSGQTGQKLWGFTFVHCSFSFLRDDVIPSSTAHCTVCGMG
jgi:hypothetical protein